MEDAGYNAEVDKLKPYLIKNQCRQNSILTLAILR